MVYWGRKEILKEGVSGSKPGVGAFRAPPPPQLPVSSHIVHIVYVSYLIGGGGVHDESPCPHPPVFWPINGCKLINDRYMLSVIRNLSKRYTLVYIYKLLIYNYFQVNIQ